MELSYKGTDYFGWQRQPNDVSVQEVLEDALTKLHSNQAVSVVGCGRTDTGVHAHHYVLHFDFETIPDPEQFVFKLNRMLPDSIAVHRVQEQPEDFHARFQATERTYRYYIHTRKDAFLSEQSWYFPQTLDFSTMNQAAQHLLGKQDFTSLSKLHTDVKTNVCDVRFAAWNQVDDHRHYFEIRADRFLRNMVRATVGTLIEVGLGKISPQEVRNILDAKNRQAAAMSVPPQGLYLWEISY